MDLGLLTIERHVDRLLAPHRGSRPGLTVGVVQRGALVAHRSAGLASVELGVPIGPETRFRIASVSKQFTCAAVLLLAQDGKLAPDDPVCRHLPNLPATYGGVTLDHLMHNVGGVRDMLQLLRQGGADLGQPVTRADLLDAICRQDALNFEPGTRYLYSNAGFLLLGLVVERVAGEPLAAFLERRVFSPVGMTRTAHVEDPRAAVPGLATGYLPADGGWTRAPHAFPIGGEGGLVSCVEDLALWDQELATGRRLGPALGRALTERTSFPDGSACAYARGLQVASWHGVSTVSHGGLWPGYKTEFLRAPDLDLAVIAISNDGGADPNALAHRFLDLLAEGTPGYRPPPKPDPEGLAQLPGRWLDPETGITLDADLLDGRPRLRANGVPLMPEPTEDGWFAVHRGSVVLKVRPGMDSLEAEWDAGQRTLLRRVEPGAALPDTLPGTYTCDETAATWTFSEDGAVSVTGPVVASARWQAEGIAGDCFRIQQPDVLFPTWLDLRAVRDDAGRIAMLEVTAGRARGLRYIRRP